MKIINNQPDIKIGQFTQEEKLKAGKLLVLMKYIQEYGRQGNSMTYCSDTAMLCITRTQ